MEYIYDAAGNKLAKKLNGAFVNCGSVVYTGSKTPEYVAHSQGMARANGSAWNYQYNLTDHSGNVRYATDAGKTFEQSTDYFPFGLAHSTTPTGLAKNKYLYNSKELQTELGFNLLDYHARFYDATIGILDQIDPMVEKYAGLSPYAYCGNNPISKIDPDGKYWLNASDKEYALSIAKKMTDRIDEMLAERDKLINSINKNSSEKKIGELNEINANILNLIEGTVEIATMGMVSDQAFTFNKTEGNIGGADIVDGVIVMNVVEIPNAIHELAHGYDFYDKGRPQTSAEYFGREEKAYKRQYSYDDKSIPKSDWYRPVKGINDITPNWVQGVKDNNGDYIYLKRLYGNSYNKQIYERGFKNAKKRGL